MKTEGQLSTGLNIASKSTDLIHILNFSSLVKETEFEESPKKIDFLNFLGYQCASPFIK
jgi:hypothetical protein